MRILLATLCLVLCATSAWATDPICNNGSKWLRQRLTDADKTTILNLHNILRQQIANGSVAGWPPSNNMMRLTWNDNLTDAAKVHSNLCEFRHFQPPSKWTGPKYGQNLAVQWEDAKGAKTTPEWANFIQAWYNEISMFPPSQRFPFVTKDGCGHFTQLIWADSAEVGCSWTQYEDAKPPANYPNFTSLYTCNYSPAGNSVARNDPELAATLYIYKNRTKSDTACSGCTGCYEKVYKDLCDK